MDTKQEEIKRTKIQVVAWRLKRYFTVPKLYVALLTSKDVGKPSITLWSFAKNEGKVMMECLEIEEKYNMEMFFKEKISIWKLLAMFFSTLFKF